MSCLVGNFKARASLNCRRSKNAVTLSVVYRFAVFANMAVRSTLGPDKE
jgi:hypothetical protein